MGLQMVLRLAISTRLLQRSASTAAREKAVQKSLAYLSKIQIQETGKETVFSCNGKPLKFGEFESLATPNKLLAQLVMMEWKHQASSGVKLDIPIDLKAILAEASDLKHEKLTRESVYQDVLRYLSTDTLLFWDEDGTGIREWQNEHWKPALETFCKSLNLPALQIADGLFQVQQHQDYTTELIKLMEEFNYYQLSAFDFMVKNLKSTILAWGLVKNVFSIEEAVRLGLLELDYQGHRWGRRPEYHDLSTGEIARRLCASKLFFCKSLDQ